MKPVAWARQDGVIAFHKQKEVDSQGYKWFPLYTLKELTDEEIWELHQEHIDEVICGHSMKTVGFIEFARAILRKAQE